MWGRDKVWTHFRNDVLAADAPDAGLLMGFLRRVFSDKLHTACLEVFDLQRYRVFRTPQKVRAALGKHADVPFVFITGKN